MSYTRSYSSSVTVSGSRTVHYPASQYGGSETVHFSETVPVYINIHVETTPFDSSVSNIGRDVDGLTASVAAMNAANCAAIVKNADKISDSLIKGFYSLVQNDVTVKKAESNSQLQAKSALLMEISKDISDKHTRMSADMERLYAHYGAIFRDLDSELEKRISDIDRPAFDLAEKVRNDIIMKPSLVQGAGTADKTLNEGNMMSGISVARIRSKASQVLSVMAESIRKNLQYRKTMHDTLWAEPAESDKELYVPVAYFVSDTVGTGQQSEKCFAPDNSGHDEIMSKVSSHIHSEISSEGKNIPDEEMMFIDQAFSSMVESSYLSHEKDDEYNERVYAEILRLWQSNKTVMKQI